MTKPVQSRHLRGTSEVVLLPKLRPGFVDNPELIMAYGTRLKAMLITLFELRRVATDLGTGDNAGPIERLRTVFAVQWTVLEQEQALLVSASFDKSWEDYFRVLYDVTGPLLDAIFMHCEGYRDFSADFMGFAAWVRDTQRACDFFYHAHPDITVDDVRYVRELLQVPDAQRATVVVGAPVAPVLPQSERAARMFDLARAVQALFSLRKYFPETEKLGPKRTARSVFDLAMSGIFYSQTELLGQLVQSGALPSAVSAWASALLGAEAARLAQRPASKPVTLDRATLARIQGGIVRPYGRLNLARVLLVHCENREAFGRFLGHVIQKATRESALPAETQLHFNVAFSYRGLERLGVPPGELQRLPAEFREGMEARAGLLGDVDDPDYPEHLWPLRRNHASAHDRVPMSLVDATVMLQVRDVDGRGQAEIEQAYDQLSAIPGVQILHVQHLKRDFLSDSSVQREPFGFVEGSAAVSSQPVPNAHLELDHKLDLTRDAAKRDVVALGELLLGYADRHGQHPYAAMKLVHNGTFVVLRKLEQRPQVIAERAQTLAASGSRMQRLLDAVYSSQATVKLSLAPRARRRRALKLGARIGELVSHRVLIDRAKAWMMGRTLEGQPLAAPAGCPNDFDYANDAGRCPLFSHIRRANPRTEGTPRILRCRYTFEDNGVRGSLFMATNANIAGQFEVIQRWINGGNSTGLHSAQQDLIAGQGDPSRMPYYMNPDGTGQRAARFKRERSVRLHWGCYLFMPSIEALEQFETWAKGGQAWAVDERAVARGEALIASLRALARAAQVGPQSQTPAAREQAEKERVARVRGAWKQILEEPANYERAADVWAAVRERHAGVLDVPELGVLAGSLQAARTVLSDGGAAYSVRQYAQRMQDNLGEHYLGFDRVGAEGQRYDRESKVANAFFRTLAFDAVFASAFAYGCGVLETLDGPSDLPAARRIETAQGARIVVDVERYGGIVAARWAQEVIGLASAEKTPAQLLEELTKAVLVSRRVFQSDAAQSLISAAGSKRADFREPEDPFSLQSGLMKHWPTQDRDKDIARRALHGAAVGFAAPAIAAIRSVLDLWAEDGELFANAEAARAQGQRLAQWLRPLVIEGLARRPIPTFLYREAQDGAVLGDEIAPGRLVYVGLGSVHRDAQRQSKPEPEAWLFGGEPTGEEKEHTSHGCPAREAALGVIAGGIAALLVQRELRVELRSVLSCAAPPRP